MLWLGLCSGHFRDLVTEECDLELVLTQAFLEVDKALVKHLHFSPNGRFVLKGGKKWSVHVMPCTLKEKRYFENQYIIQRVFALIFLGHLFLPKTKNHFITMTTQSHNMAAKWIIQKHNWHVWQTQFSWSYVMALKLRAATCLVGRRPVNSSCHKVRDAPGKKCSASFDQSAFSSNLLPMCFPLLRFKCFLNWKKLIGRMPLKLKRW